MRYANKQEKMISTKIKVGNKNDQGKDPDV